MITCKDLEVGTRYRFSKNTLLNNPQFTDAVFEKREDHSVIVEKGWHPEDYIGETASWNGHEAYSVEVVEQPQVLPASSVPPVTVKREVLTIDKIGVGQTFIVHGKPEEVYVKISNSHVFNHKLLQMHATDAQRFTQHLNLVVVELVVYNGK